MMKVCKLVLFALSLMSFSMTELIAQGKITLDDFSGVSLSTTTLASGESDFHYSNASHVAGKTRALKAGVNSNRNQHGLRYGMNQGMLIASFGYDTRGKLVLVYGKSKTGPVPLDLDLSKARFLKIKFGGKSSKSGVNVQLFTSSANRAAYSTHALGREGTYTLDIPLKDFKIVREFDWKQVKQIKIQLDSRNLTGHNFAVDEIWFE